MILNTFVLSARHNRSITVPSYKVSKYFIMRPKATFKNNLKSYCEENLLKRQISKVKIELANLEVPMSVIKRDWLVENDVPIWRQRLWVEHINRHLKIFKKSVELTDLFPEYPTIEEDKI